MKKGVINLYFAMMLFLSFNASVAYAQTEQTVTSLSCGTNIFAPYGFEENGEIKGIEVEILQEIGKRTNIKIDLKIYAWGVLLDKMKRGTLDCMFAAFRTDERVEFMYFTRVPIHVSSLVFFTKKDSSFKFKTIEDLKGYKIGIVREFKNPPSFDDGEKNQWYQVFRLRNIEINFKILNKGFFDAVLVSRHVGEYTTKKMGLSEVIVPLANPVSASSAYITFTKKKNLEYLVDKFDAALFEIFTDGTYWHILEKYLKN